MWARQEYYWALHVCRECWLKCPGPPRGLSTGWGVHGELPARLHLCPQSLLAEQPPGGSRGHQEESSHAGQEQLHLRQEVPAGLRHEHRVGQTRAGHPAWSSGEQTAGWRRVLMGVTCQMVTIFLRDAMTVEEFLAAGCIKKGLSPVEHFIRVKKRRDMPTMNYFVPHRSDLIETYVSPALPLHW